MKLVFVHGRAQNGRSSKEIVAEWLTALNQGLSIARLDRLDVEPVAPYYGDALLSFRDEARRGLALDATPRGPADDGYRKFLGEYADAVSRSLPIDDSRLARRGFLSNQQRLVSSGRAGDFKLRTARSQDDIFERGPENWSWVIAIVRSLDDLFPGLSRGGIELVLRDVYVYCTDTSFRKSIDASVKAALPSGPSIVIGHSLGSVVAYNVLHATNAAVAHFITVGSPLAIKAIKERLPVAPQRPPGVAEWYNARDPADIVALNPLTATCFPTHPQVANNDAITNSSENHHHISGYLGHRDIAAYVGRAWAASAI
jgi:hypothetical protein